MRGGILALIGALASMQTGAQIRHGAPLIEFNDDGGWCWFEDERAIVAGGKLVFGTIATGGARQGHVEATVYDLKTRESKRVTLHTPADEKDRRQWADDHNSPAFLQLPSGEILTLYAKHGPEEKIYYRISKPGDPLVWGDEQVFVPSPTSRVTYSNLHMLTSENAPRGRIYDFYRGFNNSFKPSFAWSNDLGRTWSAGGVFIDVPTKFRHRPYVKYASNGRDSVHFAYTDGHPQDFDNSIYHAVYRAGDLLGSDGARIRSMKDGLEAPEEGTLVYKGGAEHVAWITDLQLDKKGRPYMVFSVQMNSAGKPPGQGGEDLRYHYARFDGKRWQAAEIAYAGTRIYPSQEDYTGLAALHPGDPKTIYISTNADPVTGAPLISKSDNQRHWEIYRGTTRDYRKWNWEAITRDSKADNLRPVVSSQDSKQTILLWLQGKMRAYTDYTFRVVGMIGKR
jgi:hypothetical protein